MDQTLKALGDILLQALPTFFLVIALYVYLNRVFFRPLGEVLEARREAIEGVRTRAEAMLRRAEQKTAEYEAALQAARSEIYREQETERRKNQELLAERLKQARDRAHAQLAEARATIARDVEQAKTSIAGESESLAEQIIHLVLERGVAAR
jgi:F-type H+-transporting ATPase subunit b